jgi:hypothetical protein
MPESDMRMHVAERDREPFVQEQLAERVCVPDPGVRLQAALRVCTPNPEQTCDAEHALQFP